MNDQLGELNSTYVFLWLAFNAWMVIDAIRRRAASYWYFVILFFPLGALLYFFIVKLRDLRSNSEPNQGEPTELQSVPSSLRSIIPLEKPDLDSADNLEENERYAEAAAFYRRALELNASNKQALHGLGRCLVGLGRAQDSLTHFEKLLELDREYRNYSAALDYADALWEAGQKADTLELLERLTEVTGRINHRLALGHYLAEFGQTERARQEITRALETVAQQPDASNARVRHWVERGQRMLAALDKTEEPPPS